jgi:hypothetical protein
VKDQAHIPPMPQSLRELRDCISQGVANVDEPQLPRAWEEFEHRVGDRRVTNGAHSEHLEMNLMSFLAFFRLCRAFVCNRLRNSLISYYQNHL